MRTTRGTTARATCGIAGLTAVLLLAGCGAALSGKQAGPSAPAAAASASTSAAIPCTQIRLVRTSLTSLAHLKVTNPAAAATAASDLVDVKTQVRRLAAQVSTDFSGEIRLLSAGLDVLAADVRQAAVDPSPARIAAAGSAVRRVRAIVSPLVAEIRTACPRS